MRDLPYLILTEKRGGHVASVLTEEKTVVRFNIHVHLASGVTFREVS